MEQFEQLLTCAICLDRYRNPKLLPCQHSFCMEPCMDGLVDYVRRQVKCPECRAEHRIPYQGVQGYPTNVTLQRFLELHIEITGELPDPTSGQIMERCNVCSEKAYCSVCVHCEKKICGDCKGAHMDILRREISRINNQIRRAMHRLQDALALVEKNQCSLIQNCSAVSEEVDEIYRRLNKALKDRTEYLRGEIDRYLSVEQRNLSTLKENLEQEISNIQSNCDLADKHMTENVEWDDCELMDAKEIFLKTVEFIRNFEYENADYARRVRFTMSHDPNQLVLHVAGYGELTINVGQLHGGGPGGGSGGGVTGSASTGGLLAPPGGGPGLMRSKSDHRLASQFRQQEEEQQQRRGYGRRGTTAGDDDYRGEFESPYDNEGGRAGRRYGRSRFTRHLGGGGDGDSDTDAQTGRSVRFQGDAPHHKERERVLDTEDVSRGPLSGITRLYDSPRVMKRLQESENRGKKKESAPATPAPTVPATPKAPGAAAAKRAPAATRQVSEDDEIARIKKQNKAASASTGAAGDAEAPARPQAERVAALKQGRAPAGGGSDASSEGDSAPASPTRRTPPAPEGGSSDAESDDGSSVSALAQRKTSTGTKGSAGSRRSSNSSDATAAGAHKKAARSGSSDSTTSSESSAASSSRPADDSKGRPNATAPTPAAGTKPFQSRFLNSGRSTTAAPEKPSAKDDDDEDESESDSSSESEETDSEEESDDASKKKPEPAPPASKTDIGALLARSQQARETTEARRRDSRDESSSGYGTKRYGTGSSSTAATASEGSPTRSGYQSRYGAPKEEPAANKYLSGRARTAAAQPEEDSSSRYGSGYTSRFLNKSKSSAALSPEEDSDRPRYGTSRTTSTTASSTPAEAEESRYPSGRTRYAALKDRRQRLARSRSSHNFGGGDDEEQDDSPSSPTSSIPSSYLPSRYGPGSSSAGSASASAAAGSGGSDLSRSRSTHALKSRENSPERGGAGAGAGGEKDGAALSSWARYLKNKYGNRGKDGKDGPAGAGSSAAASATAARRLSLGLPLRHNSASVESSDDDQKNPAGSPTSPTAATAAAAAAAAGFAVAAAGSSPRSQYLQKRRQQFKVGSRGSEPGYFTWPRGIAVGPDNSIVVADSSNHRVQVFDSNGIFVKEFGTYGNGEGEFDCLAGVAVNRIGQFIIADRYNHRIQVMDPSGRFLRAFGSQGTADGRFNYPWGITTDALGFIYVCDKENHRVQVFQSDGTFVGKFGSCGSKPGQLEHPHYIAVSNTNRVIVSDSNNHRVQIFDVNGKVLTSFGTEGSDEGQFKFPRHVKKSKSSHRVHGLPIKLSRSRSFKTNTSPSTKSVKKSTVHPTINSPLSTKPHKRSTVRPYTHSVSRKGTVVDGFQHRSHSPSSKTPVKQLISESYPDSYSSMTTISKKDSSNHNNTFSQNSQNSTANVTFQRSSPHSSTPKNSIKESTLPNTFHSPISSNSKERFPKGNSTYKTTAHTSKTANYFMDSNLHDTSQTSSSINSFKDSRHHPPTRTPISNNSLKDSTHHIQSQTLNSTNSSKISSHHSTSYTSNTTNSFTDPNYRAIPHTSNSRDKSTLRSKSHSLSSKNSNQESSFLLSPNLPSSTQSTSHTTAHFTPDVQTLMNPPTRSLSPRARRARSHAARIASKAVIASKTEGSSSGRSRVHLCSRLGEQQNTDLPSGWDISPSLWMLGVGRRGVQRSGGNSGDVQRQHSSLRQGESQNTSVLTSCPQVKPAIIRKPVHKLNTSALTSSVSHQNRIISPIIMPAMKTVVANTIQVNKRRPSLHLPSHPVLSPLINYRR